MMIMRTVQSNLLWCLYVLLEQFFVSCGDRENYFDLEIHECKKGFKI